MNHILYNIAIIMLLSGIIILTSYLSRTYQQRTPTPVNVVEDDNYIEKAYNMRPTQIFNTMFTQPSLWQSYQTLNQPITQKLI